MNKEDLRQWVAWWENNRKRWRELAILDGCLGVLQITQGLIWLRDDMFILGGIMCFSAGVMCTHTVKCIRHMREIRENHAFLEELLRQEELRNELSDET